MRDVRVNGITGVRFGVPRPVAVTSGAKGGSPSASQGPVRVQIHIYDTGGRLVRTAVNDALQPGYYQYQWDVLNDGGERAAPGVYIIIMTAPGFSHRTKLIVTR